MEKVRFLFTTVIKKAGSLHLLCILYINIYHGLSIYTSYMKQRYIYYYLFFRLKPENKMKDERNETSELTQQAFKLNKNNIQ